VEVSPYQTEIERWRERQEAELRADDGWLTLAGLFWLEEGVNRFGASPDNEIVLPEDSAPDYAGSIAFHAGAATLHAEPSVGVSVGGKLVIGATQLRSDAEAESDLITLGDLTMVLIRRGARHAIRLWDRRSPARQAFSGRRWYPVREAYRLTAHFVPRDPPHTLAVPNILGETEPRLSPGYAAFTINGQAYSLDAVTEGEELFFIFRDQTGGDTTYPAGRFLKAAFPQNGQITLDFNRAYSPPCAFTAFATCPLPPAQNRLALRVDAGEKKYGDGHPH